MADSRLAKIYYSPRGYWKGLTAIEELASAAKISEDLARAWLKKQAIWQIYLPAPQHVPWPRFDMAVGVVGSGNGVLYLTSPGRPTEIGLQLGKACYPCSR